MSSAGDEGFIAIAIFFCAAGKVYECVFVSHERGAWALVIPLASLALALGSFGICSHVYPS